MKIQNAQDMEAVKAKKELVWQRLHAGDLLYVPQGTLTVEHGIGEKAGASLGVKCNVLVPNVGLESLNLLAGMYRKEGKPLGVQCAQLAAKMAADLD